MDRLPLLGGSYLARSIIASATRCVNYYPEINPKDSLVPMTYYQRPGLVTRASGPEAPVRGLYQASDGTCYAVIGQNFYQVGQDFLLRLIGQISAGTSLVSMIDNGTTLVIVDGSQTGWQYFLKTATITTTGNVYASTEIDSLSSVAGIAVGMTVTGSNLIGSSTLNPIRVSAVPGTTSVTINQAGSATVCAFNASISGNTLTVGSVASGTLLVGSTIIAPTVIGGTKIAAFGTGTGGTGTYTLDGEVQTVAGTDMTATSGGGEEIVFTAVAGFFAPITDPTGTFTGADRIDYIDTFLVWNIPRTNRFGVSLSDLVGFDPTQVAAKTDYPDPIVTLIVNRHELILLGRLKSEIWYDAGNPTFPMAELPGAYIEHGVVAKYSIAASDINIFWLGQDLQGQGVVFRQRGYQTTRISNHALERAIRQMALIGPGIADAIGMTFQIEGHVFYLLSFPAGDETWVYDDSVQDPMLAWHQESWTEPGTGRQRRHRANCAANFFGRNIVGDHSNGTLYELDLETYTDEVAGTVGPILFVKTFPHIGQGRGKDGLPMLVNGKRVQFRAFAADIECGTSPVDTDGRPAQITLRWSDDRGRTYGNDVLQSGGALGEYLTQPLWPGLGIARDRIFEISHSIAGPAALNSAWVDAEVLES